MDIFPLFSIGLGIKKVPEGLPFAREIFKENKKLFTPVKNVSEHSTTLIGYKYENIVASHKNTMNLKKVKELIYTNAFNFFVGCGYDETKYDLKVVNIWLNEMQQSATKNNRHIHYGYEISGCYYVDMPKDAGGIVFTNNDINIAYGSIDIKTFTTFNSKTCQINPEEGDMLFWRSDLPHEVFNSKFNGVRRSIAFDISVLMRA